MQNLFHHVLMISHVKPDPKLSSSNVFIYLSDTVRYTMKWAFISLCIMVVLICSSFVMAEAEKPHENSLLEFSTNHGLGLVEAELVDLDEEGERPKHDPALIKKLAARRRSMAKKRALLQRQKRMGVGKDASNKFYDEGLSLVKIRSLTIADSERKNWIAKEASWLNDRTHDIRNEELGYNEAMTALKRRLQ